MKVVCLLCFVLVCAQAQDFKIVNLNQGPVRGYKSPDYDVYSFYEIPYATAPTGVDKFKAPLPPPNWTQPLEAVNRDIRCPQYQDGPFNYQEDCLVASVFAPDTEATNLPVVFYVHGGGFQVGFGNSRPPYQLVNHKKNIIFVTFNYRLGPHGFLCLGTPDIPGNAAMKDQLAALRWVRDNIASFGGNPDDITLTGCSAGGASVDALILSKKTEGLYKRVIGQSGANIGAFLAQVDPTENARNYAKELGYDGPDNIAALEGFFKDISYERLHSIDLGNTKDVAVVFSPCVERDLGSETFLDDTPSNILRSGNYVRSPMLYGWANMEGLYRLRVFEEWRHDMNEDFSQFLPADLRFETPEQKREVAQQVKEFYFANAPVSGDNILSYIDFCSDAMFIVAMQRAVTLQVEAGNSEVYLSVYSYVNNVTNPIPYTDVKGATHCMQARVVLDEDERGMTVEDLEMKNIMRDIWLNFIYTGNPTPDGSIPPSVPKWTPAGANRTPVMDLGNTIKILPQSFATDRQAFWDDIYDRFHREPVAPYDFNNSGQSLRFSMGLGVFLLLFTNLTWLLLC